jgi:hypothetical protein
MGKPGRAFAKGHQRDNGRRKGEGRNGAAEAGLSGASRCRNKLSSNDWEIGQTLTDQLIVKRAKCGINRLTAQE